MTETSRRSVTNDTAWLLGGHAAGLLVTFVATPIELERMGAERYGIVVAVIGVVGYFAFVEVASSWALLRFIPWYRALRDEDRARRLAGVALTMTSAFGILGALALWALAPLISGMFQLSEDQQEAGRLALQIMAFYLPMTIVGTTLSGIGRALGHFRFTAILSALSLTSINGVWVAVAGTRHDVAIVVGTHVLVGALSVAAWVVLLQRTDFKLSLSLNRAAVGELARFGGPAAATQTSFGLVTQLDKPVLGSVLPVGALPSYAIPFSFALRIMALSSALASAIFPRVAEEFAAGRRQRVEQLTLASLRTVAVGGGAVTIGAIIAGGPFLELWIGREFAATAATPLATLSFGFSLMAYGSIGQLLLDSQGRVGITASISAVGGALGLTGGALLAKTGGSPAAASFGIAAGLAIIGVLSIELARRIVVPVQFIVVWRPLIAAWLPLAAAGVVAAPLAALVADSVAWRALAPLAPLVGVAYWQLARIRHIRRGGGGRG